MTALGRNLVFPVGKAEIVFFAANLCVLLYLVAPRDLLQDPLRFAAPDLDVWRQRKGELDHAMIEERRAHFQ